MNTSKLTALRKSTAPYLPPPLLRLIHAIDTYVHLYYRSVSSTDDDNGEDKEASMKIVSSLVIAYLLYRCIQLLFALIGGGSKRSTVHLTDDSVLKHLGGGDMNNNTNINGGIHKFDDTVLFWGEMNSGKTALLHRLLFDHHRDANDENKNNKLDEKNGTKWQLPMTVSSMVANAIYLDAIDKSNNNNKAAVVRIIDYPGHPSLSSQFIPLLSPSSLSSTHRLIFTIDTTQPIVDSVNRLYHSILIHPAVRSSYSRDNNGLDVLITCTKTDLKGSKNYKRIKIQMRNEMERLRKVDEALGSKSTDGAKEWRLEGKNIDLDNLGKDVPIRLYFVEVSLGDVDCLGLKVVRDFVLFGVVPDGAKK